MKNKHFPCEPMDYGDNDKLCLARSIMLRCLSIENRTQLRRKDDYMYSKVCL